MSAPPGPWPSLNDRVRVRLDLPAREGGEELDLTTRVEDVLPHAVVLAAPAFAGDLHLAVAGLEVTVSWATDRGYCRQDFALAEVTRDRIPCWVLEPLSDVVQEQRRRFVRVPVPGTVVLSAVPLPEDEDDAPDPATLSMVDLSEGGACVRGPALPFVAPGRRVRVAFDCGASPVDQLAEVLLVRPAPGPARLDPDLAAHDAVLVFVDPVPAADRIRQHVLQLQIAHRRRGDR